MRHVLIVVLCVLFGAVLAPPAAGAADACTDPDTGELILAEEQTYLHQAETKAGNLAALGASGFPSWNSEAPTQSVQQGAGGGYLMPFGAYLAEDHYEETGLTAEGTFSGCLDTMLFELYAFLPTNRTGTSGSLAESPFNGVVTLDIDNVRVAHATEVEMATVPNAAGSATYRIRFAYTKIHAAMTRLQMDPASDHVLRINVIPRYANTSNALFVYDTTEVPAGILFNGTADDTYTVIPT